MKRDKGNFHRDDAPVERKLEEEFDSIVNSVNSIEETLSKKISELKSAISTLTKASQISGGGGGIVANFTGGPSLNVSEFNERISFGRMIIPIIKEFTYEDTSLNIVNIQADDIIMICSVVITTADSGVTDFRLNDGTADRAILSDIDFSGESVNIIASLAWLTYTAAAELTMSLLGATTAAGKIGLIILRRPMV